MSLQSGLQRWHRSSARRRLALADRMISLGMLTAATAHEMASPLTAITANLDHGRQALERARLAAGSASDDARETLEDALSEASAAVADALAGAAQATTVLKDLKAFARSPGEARAVLPLRAVVDRAVRLVTPEIGRRARIATALEDAPSVHGNEGLLTQVLVDLLVNAAQALSRTPRPDDEITVAARREGGQAVVEVSDTGTGIPPSVLPHVFEPFFTTKSPEIGTGLGLWICQQIVSAHGGTIEVESSIGRGTRMRVRLPACSEGGEGGRSPS